MTGKAYIVANEQQEREVLEKLERDGFKWNNGSRPTKIIREVYEPITIFVRDDKRLTYANGVINEYLVDSEIVYDGRKEKQMSDKYVVSQEFMDKLEEWKDTLITAFKPGLFVGNVSIKNLPETVSIWWDGGIPDEESNNRLIAILRWVNGEDVFEVEKPKKWVVRNKETDSTYCYAQLLSESNNTLFMGYSLPNATRFDTKEEAESWANSHQEVVSVEE